MIVQIKRRVLSIFPHKWQWSHSKKEPEQNDIILLFEGLSTVYMSDVVPDATRFTQGYDNL